jgi:hypothetical protein
MFLTDDSSLQGFQFEARVDNEVFLATVVSFASFGPN